MESTPLTVTLAPDVSAPAVARRLLRDRCGQRPVPLEAAVLLTSELVTHAVRQGEPPVILTVHCRPDRIRVEVQARGAEPPAPPAPAPGAQPAETDQRWRATCWQLLTALASSWGSERRGPSTVVWFTLALD